MSEGNNSRNASTSSSAMSGEIGPSGTSYPSPVSTAQSPELDQSALANGEHGGGDPRQQLRSASSVLQAAYRRVRQVRRSLIELDSRSSDSANIGPDHSALLLTTSPVEDSSSDTDDTLDLQALRSNLSALDRQSQEYLDRFAPGSWTDYHPPELPRPRRQIQLPSPSPSAETPLLRPRRSMLESHLARRREILDPNDSATFLGRRVAAREAAGPSRPTEQPQPQTDPVLRAVEMEQLVLRAITHQHATDPGTHISSRPETRAPRSLDIEVLRTQRHQSSNTNANVPRPPPRRWRAYRVPPETRQNSGSTQSPASANSHPDRDRLSILSSFSSVQNLATPTSSVARDRPLLFDEPTSYTNGPTRPDSRDIVESPIGSERSYFIHRRVNADGDELVHNINLEWDDEDPLSWLVPPRERDLQDHPAFAPRRRYEVHHRADMLRAARMPAPVPEPRRRGWARLDADGNAIPSEEEEELERSRAEYRMQALYHSRANPNPQVVPSRARTRNSVDSAAVRSATFDSGAFSNLITRTSVSPDDDFSRETSSPRVRLNSRDAGLGGPRVGFGSVMDSVLSVDNRPRHTHPVPVASSNDSISNSLDDALYGSSVPFVVDPLPIPLRQMTSPKNKKGTTGGIRVSRGAGLAGR